MCNLWLIFRYFNKIYRSTLQKGITEGYQIITENSNLVILVDEKMALFHVRSVVLKGIIIVFLKCVEKVIKNGILRYHVLFLFM